MKHKQTVWILTTEHNQYNQFGEYFQAVFGEKPTIDELSEQGIAEGTIQHVLAGGGQKGIEGMWYILREYEVTYGEIK